MKFNARDTAPKKEFPTKMNVLLGSNIKNITIAPKQYTNRIKAITFFTPNEFFWFGLMPNILKYFFNCMKSSILIQMNWIQFELISVEIFTPFLYWRQNNVFFVCFNISSNAYEEENYPFYWLVMNCDNL